MTTSTYDKYNDQSNEQSNSLRNTTHRLQHNIWHGTALVLAEAVVSEQKAAQPPCRGGHQGSGLGERASREQRRTHVRGGIQGEAHEGSHMRGAT